MAVTVGATPATTITEIQPAVEQSSFSDAIAQQSPAGGPDNATDENQTEHHRNPENASGDGSQTDIKRWLVSSMAGRLKGSAINLSQGEYQLAQSVLGEGFGDDLGRYVNVAGETDTQQDDQVAQTFNETQQAQQTYSEQVSEFERLYDEYQAAREAGDTERARQLAKRLERLASQINATGQTLVERYETLSNTTGVSLEEGRQAISNTTNQIVAEAQRVVNQSLVRTELRITSVTSTASYDDPLVIEGRYVTENGTAIGDSAVELVVPGPTTNTTTAANGSFTLTHRPIDLEAGVQNLTVAAMPDNASVYLPTTTTVTTEIEPIEPNISFVGVFDQISFGEQRSVAVDVTVADRPAGGVPVTITLDGTVLTTGRTTESGTFESTVRLPASVRNGSMDLVARAGVDGRAVSEATTSRTVVVESTPTDLTLETTNGSAIRVHGRLTTTDGVPVADQPLQLSVDGTVVETVRTNATGAFVGSIDGESVPIGESVTVTAVYDEPTSNLASSEASAIAERMPEESGGSNDPGADQNDSAWDILTNPIVVAAGVVSVAGLFIAGYLWRRRSPSQTPTDTPSNQSEIETPQSSAPTPTTLADVEATLERDGPDAAVVSLYEMVSRDVSADTRPDQTPRERYRAVRDALSAEQASVFERVTTLYEQAEFAPETVPTDRIEDVIEAVRKGFVDETDAPADD